MIPINKFRAATVDFWRWSHHRHAAAAAAVFYFAKSRQDLGLAGLTSRGGPANATSILDLVKSL